jgi:ABC-type transport system substrate-binding protein
VAGATARYLENAGLKVTVRTVDWAKYLRKASSKQTAGWDLYYLGWGNPLLEAGYTLNPEFVSSPLCRVGLADLVGLLRRAFYLGPPERYRLYRKIQVRLRAAYPWIFLYQGVDNYAVSRDLELTPRPNGTFRVFYDLAAGPED